MPKGPRTPGGPPLPILPGRTLVVRQNARPRYSRRRRTTRDTAAKASGTSAIIRGGPRIASFELRDLQQVAGVSLPQMIGVDSDLVDQHRGGALGANQDADGVGAGDATMQLLHHTCRSRIDRLKLAAVTGSSLGKCGSQQRFSA